MIIVTPLSAVEETIARYRPSHMITLLSPEHMIETPQGIVPERHLRLGFNDVADAWGSESPPGVEHVEKLILFGRTWDAANPLLVHCWAGISRSNAAAYILLCDRHGPGHEEKIAKALRLRAPHAYPNPLMIRLADAMMGRSNRMVEAVRGMGRGMITAMGERCELPVSLDEL